MKTYKISVIGDVMSESTLLESVRQADGSYNYDEVFLPLKGLLAEADYRIANLESPVAGEEMEYAKSIVSFNAPDSLVTALQKIGIDAVSTANNHATDRGNEGLIRTLDTLDRLGMAHTGTYRSADEERIHYFQLGDTTVAMIAYTYGVNEWPTQDKPTGLEQLNFLIHPEDKRRVTIAPKYFGEAMAFIKEATGQELDWTQKIQMKSILQIPIPYPDDSKCDESVLHRMVPQIRKDLEEARKKADLVLYLPHTGGQFNVLPGHASEVAMENAAKMGFDAILAAHSHTTQKAAYLGDCPAFYSLGNVSMCSRTVYSQHQTLPMYGLVAQLYVAEKEIVRVGYSIFKIVDEEGSPMRIVPVDELYAALSDPEEKAALEKDVAEVVERVCGASLHGPDAIRREYRL